ncbi:MAG: amidohydrolase [Halodesulfurarchaeum sp.]
MTSQADVVFIDGEVHTMTDPDRTAEAVAVRDGEIVRVGDTYEIDFLTGVETRVVNLDGRILLPGFIDAHTHMQHLGQSLVHADLSDCSSLEDMLTRLSRDNDPDHEWILGFGYDESEWDGDGEFPNRSDLDSVSMDRPVAVFRIDMHTASINSVALDHVGDRLPEEGVKREHGEPTGVLVEAAVDELQSVIDPDRPEMRSVIESAASYAVSRGVTGVHDMVRRSTAPAVYRELDREGHLPLRVTINYWSDHLEAVTDLGLLPGSGSDTVQMGAVKSFSDGSIGARTAKLESPYADDPGETGEWVVHPSSIEEFVEEASAADQQVAIHAIGDEAIREVLELLESVASEGRRHRIEHAELLPDDLIDQFEAADVVASVQPNFLKWARPGGLYDRRLGEQRRASNNPFGAMAEAGIPLAFGSDCMPMDPLFGIHQVVTAPEPEQRLSVTDAVRAYTRGSAYAGFDEDRLGSIVPGKLADFVVLERSPWEHQDSIADIDVAMTVVDGTVVFDRNRD